MTRDPSTARESRRQNGTTERRTALQTHWLLRFASDAYDGPTTADNLAGLALDLLEEKFSFVAITEQFEKSAFLICDMFGWPLVAIWRRRRAIKGRANPSDFPQEIIAKIESVVEPDLVLYERYAELLNQHFETADFGSEFTRYMADRKEDRDNIQASSAEVTFDKLHRLESENRRLHQELDSANAKLKMQGQALSELAVCRT